MTAIILSPTQSEDIDLIQYLFNTQIIIALDTMPSFFNRIYPQLHVPENYIQSFTMTDCGYLYFFRPQHVSDIEAKNCLINLQKK